MAYSLQMRDVQSSSIKNISGFCVTSPEFFEITNEVTRRLMRRGGWWNTEFLFRICVDGCNIVWPRQVGTVLGARMCCRGVMPLKNNWWATYGYRPRGWCSDAVLRDDGTRPCYNEITGNTGKIITYRITKIQDVGKRIRIFGFKYGNQPLQELVGGAWVPGITLIAAQNGVNSTDLVTRITSVVREPTQGRCFLYEIEPDTSLFDLAMYEPDETNPAYRCSKVDGWLGIPFREDAYGRKLRQIEVLAKLEFVPVRTSDDFVLLDNIEALKYGFQAFKLAEANDDANAEGKLTLAIKELNMEIRDREPGLQTTVVVNDISSHYVMANPI